jgi:hypothetical protein
MVMAQCADISDPTRGDAAAEAETRDAAAKAETKAGGGSTAIWQSLAEKTRAASNSRGVA